ncbi:hypothetical protein ACQ5SO_20645 [Rhodovulum sp. DZ06]|uniref:hypothetical protein n=1 Tax=Rhodovulum sp. DZ06 TaxID=3425126 RepID=UPI003D334752
MHADAQTPDRGGPRAARPPAPRRRGQVSGRSGEAPGAREGRGSAARPAPRFSVPRASRAAALLAVLALSACAPQPGGRGDLGVSPGADGRTVVRAGGRQVVIAPPAGFCVDPAAVQVSGDAAFVLIEDCALAGEAGPDGPPEAEPLVMGGMITLSVGSGPLFAGGAEDRPEAARRLEAFLRSDEGRASAGMGGTPEQIRIIETRRLPDALFALVEDDGRAAAPILGPRIWRAFTELNGRAAIASLGVFETSAIGEAAMLAHLARVVAALKMANGDAISPEEAQLALAAPRPQRRPEGAERRLNAGGYSARLPAPRPGGAEVAPGAVAVASRTGAVIPPAAPRADAAAGLAGEDAPAMREAPREAPLAPPRARRG